MNIDDHFDGSVDTLNYESEDEGEANASNPGYPLSWDSRRQEIDNTPVSMEREYVKSDDREDDKCNDETNN